MNARLIAVACAAFLLGAAAAAALPSLYASGPDPLQAKEAFGSAAFAGKDGAILTPEGTVCIIRDQNVYFVPKAGGGIHLRPAVTLEEK